MEGGLRRRLENEEGGLRRRVKMRRGEVSRNAHICTTVN